jgi:dTDP-4-dehydrorhamnose reductase
LPPLQVWGGIECTVNGVGASYYDQLERNGHAHRLGDLEAPAEGRTSPATQTEPSLDMQDRSARPLLILGARGTLGRAFARVCNARGIPYNLANREQIDLSSPASVDTLLEETNAWAVVNAAGYVRVDDAEREAELVFSVNATGPAALAEACARFGVPLLAFSSDLVFDGRAHVPYTESAPVAPLNVYGHSKALMEDRVLAANPAALVIRTSAFFGPWDDANFVTSSLRELAAGRVVRAADDIVVSPTYVPDLVQAALDLLVDRERGLWHVANEGALTWSELGMRAATLAGISIEGLLRAQPASELDLDARRPVYSALASERGRIMPSIDDALARYMTERSRVNTAAVR